MKQIFCFCLVAFFSLAAHASNNINEGNWELGGSGTVLYSTSGTDKTSLILSPQAQYFFLDKFSVGAETSFFKSGSYNYFLAGPVFTKYFLVKDRVAPYVSLLPLSFMMSKGDSTTHISEARLGMKYFITDSVAFGPALSYKRVWGEGGYRSIDTLSALFQFSVHL